MWTLIILVHVGMLGKTDSNSMTNVPGFQTAQACAVAGTTSKKMVEGTTKNLEFVCVKMQ